MQRLSIWLAAALFVATACGKKSDKPRDEETTKTSEPAPPSGACASRIAEISARVAPYAAGIRTLSLASDDVELPSSKASRPIDARGPVVTVRKNALDLDGQRLGSIDALVDSLTARRSATDLAAGVESSADSPLYYRVDAELPAVALGQVVRATPAGFQPRLLVERPVGHESYDVPEGASPPLRQILEGLRENRSPSERAVFLASTMESAIGTCAPMVELFGVLAGYSVDKKQKALMTGFGPALQKCGCKGVDLDVIEVFLLAVSDAYREAEGWFPLDRTASGALSLPSGLPDAATTRELVAALEKAK